MRLETAPTGLEKINITELNSEALLSPIGAKLNG